jgi:hypothetical protein
VDSYSGNPYSTSRILLLGKEYTPFGLFPAGVILWIAWDGSSRHMQRAADGGRAGVLYVIVFDTYSARGIRKCRSLWLRGQSRASHRGVIKLGY